MSKSARVRVVGISVEFEYSDGQRKIVEVDSSKYEAMFWSDRSVTEILAPYYDRNPRQLDGELADEFEQELGRPTSVVTSDVVLDLWNSPLYVSQDEMTLPGMIFKEVQCIPHVPCKRCEPPSE